jgi:hypothetical protein
MNKRAERAERAEHDERFEYTILPFGKLVGVLHEFGLMLEVLLPPVLRDRSIDDLIVIHRE